jgi:hypothetical protein
MTEPFARPHTGPELMDARTFSELYSRMAGRPVRRRAEPQPAAPPRAATRVVDLAELGARVVSDPAAGRRASPVHLARCYASAAALLLVHRGIIQGVSADGVHGRPDAILFPAGAESVFAEVASSGAAFRGAPPAAGLDHRILRALGRDHVQEIAVLPIALRRRVVSLLYADNGCEALGDASAAALTTVCARIAAAWERLIRESRRSGRIRL